MSRLCPHAVYNLGVEVEKAKAELEKWIIYVNSVPYIFFIKYKQEAECIYQSWGKNLECVVIPFSGHIWGVTGIVQLCKWQGGVDRINF